MANLLEDCQAVQAQAACLDQVALRKRNLGQAVEGAGYQCLVSIGGSFGFYLAKCCGCCVKLR
jgi:hypothetical protein